MEDIMINYRKSLIFVCFIILLLLSSCTVVDTQTVEQIEYNYSRYEGIAQNDGYYTKFVCTSTERIEYYFEDEKYTEEQRADFINSVETLCIFLESEYEMLFEEPLCIYVSDKSMLQGTGRKLFLNDLTVESIDYVVAFLQALSGYNANYGLCYGISCYINEKLNGALLIPDVSVERLGQYYTMNANINLMDLTIPVFQTVYFSEEQNKYAYSTAYYFVKDLIERKGLKYSIDLLKNSAKLDTSFDKDYAEEKNVWLKSIGATKKYEVSTIPIRYELKLGKNTKTYPYVIYTPSTISYFVPNEKFEREGIVMDYDYIKYYLTLYEQDVMALKKYLAPYFDTENEVVPCYFNNTNKGTSYYKYTALEYASPLWAGAHEYAHYITYNDKIPVWMVEGTAMYCDFYLEHDGVYRMIKEYLGHIKSMDNEFMRLYNKNLVDIYEKSNEVNLSLFNEVMAYFENKYKTAHSTFAWISIVDKNEDGAELSYAEGGSLVNYLIKTYGEDKYFKLFEDYSKLNAIYGKTYEELKEEWLTQLKNKME